MLAVSVLFKELSRKQYFVVIFYISISTLVSALSTTVGMPEDRSAECYFESVVSNISTLASAFWTVILSIQLYSIVVLKKLFPITLVVHAIIWSLATLVTVLPLTQVRYGSAEGLAWCFLVETSNSPDYAVVLWTWLAYYFWMWLSIICFLVFTILVHFSTVRKRTKVDSGKAVNDDQNLILEGAYRTLLPYPYLLILSNFVTTIVDTFHSDNSPFPEVVGSVGNALACLQGVFISTYFMYTSKEFQAAYYHFLVYGLRDYTTQRQSTMRSHSARFESVHNSGSSPHNTLVSNADEELQLKVQQKPGSFD